MLRRIRISAMPIGQVMAAFDAMPVRSVPDSMAAAVLITTGK